MTDKSHRISRQLRALADIDGLPQDHMARTLADSLDRAASGYFSNSRSKRVDGTSETFREAKKAARRAFAKLLGGRRPSLDSF